MPINPEALINRLNPSTRSTLESAVKLCISRGNREIDIEHYLLKIAVAKGCDFECIARRWDLNVPRLIADLEKALDRLPAGWSRKVSPSQPLMRMLTEAWIIASLEQAASSIRTGATLLALLTDSSLSGICRELSSEISKINPEELRRHFPAIVSTSAEELVGGTDPSLLKTSTRTEAGQLEQYTIDLTQLARNGKIDPVLGRDKEIGFVVDILLRRRQNNPILIGEAGVGKTAVVEGFAIRIAQERVPKSLVNASVRAVDLARLQAGAGMRGEFEDRMKKLLDEVNSSPTPIILFIDEAHTLIGAGASTGSSDAANILKPALARGELRTIAATTWDEYRKYFEGDKALTRRFQAVKVDEPSEDVCTAMLRGITPIMEDHHKVSILHEAITAAVRLSSRYLTGRQLPDKAVSVLDTACSRISLSQNDVPEPINSLKSTIDDLEQRRRILRREIELGIDHEDELLALENDFSQSREQLTVLNERWEKELGIVHAMQAAQAQLQREVGTGQDTTQLKNNFQTLGLELREVQGDRPLISAFVDAQTVGQVISAWTGIPVGKMIKAEISSVLELERRMATRVIGQGHALMAICKRITTARARVGNPELPVGVFLLVGPSGVGKTETALALADEFYGGERSLITINMTEFRESHSVSTLKGSPPGYVGYKEGGILTESVRRRPYSVILLDEVEKAHPAARQLFFQIFSRGRLEDSEGRDIDFRNTIILLTSNACSDLILERSTGKAAPPDPEMLVEEVKPRLDAIFGQDFLGRVVVIPYYPLSEQALRRIAESKLDSARHRIEETYRIRLNYDESVTSEILNRCREVESGARNIDAVLTNTILPDISRWLLEKVARNEPLRDLSVSVNGDKLCYSEANAAPQRSTEKPGQVAKKRAARNRG